MGYPMTFHRFLERAKYYLRREKAIAAFTSDARRLQDNALDPIHVLGYANRAGVTPEQAKAVLEAFFARGLHIEQIAQRDGNLLTLYSDDGAILATAKLGGAVVIMQNVEEQP